MKKIDPQFIVKFNEYKDKFKYIKKMDFSDVENLPTLTEKDYLVNPTMVFTTIDEANAFVVELITHSKISLKKNQRGIKKLKKKKKAYGWYYETYQRDARKCTKYSVASNYEVEEFVPEFHCNKNRKSIKEVWKKDGSSKTYCTCCGNNIYYGDYAVIRQARICPFCLKRLGEQAQGIIERHKESDPEIEDNYNISIFVEHMG